MLNAADLNETVDKCVIQSDRPVLVCRGLSESLLVYLERYISRVTNNTSPQVINVMDCSVIPPKPCTVASLEQRHSVWDMCCVQHGQKQLLVIVDGTVSAYDLEWGELEWVHGEGMFAQAVTADTNGHLFVCDTASKSVRLFSAAGVVMGTVISSSPRGIGTPVKIDWSEELSSLIVVHTKDYDTYSMSIIHINL